MTWYLGGGDLVRLALRIGERPRRLAVLGVGAFGRVVDLVSAGCCSTVFVLTRRGKAITLSRTGLLSVASIPEFLAIGLVIPWQKARIGWGA